MCNHSKHWQLLIQAGGKLTSVSLCRTEINGQTHTSFTISCTSPAQWHEKDKWTCTPDWRFCGGIKVTEMRMCSAIAWQILPMIILHHGSLWLQHFTLTLPPHSFFRLSSFSLVSPLYPWLSSLFLPSIPLLFQPRSFIQPSLNFLIFLCISLILLSFSFFSLSLSQLQVIYRAAQQYLSISTESVWGIIITMQWKRHGRERERDMEGEWERERWRVCREKSREQTEVRSGCARIHTLTHKHTQIYKRGLAHINCCSGVIDWLQYKVTEKDGHQCPSVDKIKHCQFLKHAVNGMTSVLSNILFINNIAPQVCRIYI